MGKIEAVKAVFNFANRTFRTRTVSAKSNRLFSFAQKHKLKTPEGQLSEDGMILTHLTDVAPIGGIIDSARSAVNQTRNSVHFAVNHAVQSHANGNWYNKKYAILMPMSAARQTAGNEFAGGVAADFYSRGRVRIPQGSIIVRKSSGIPRGKYRISDSSKIEEFRDLQGVTVIETHRNSNMTSVVDNIIRRLGYKVKSGHNFNWGGSVKDFNMFNSYLRANGMKPAMHTFTPNGRTEMLIEYLGFRACKSNSWIVNAKNGDVIVDYRKECLNVLRYINKLSKQSGLPLDFDIKTLSRIIRTSDSPAKAIELIKTKLNLSPMEIISSGMSLTEGQLFKTFREYIGGGKICEVQDKVVADFVKHANRKNAQEIGELPFIGAEGICDTEFKYVPGLLESTKDKCRHFGIKFDNSTANKLEDLQKSIFGL